MRYFTIVLLAIFTTHAAGQAVLFNNIYSSGNSSAVIERQDGNYLIASTSENPFDEGVIIKLLLVDAVGDLIWDKVNIETASYSAISLLETSNNTYLVSGANWQINSPTYEAPSLLLFDSDGGFIWDEQYPSQYVSSGMGYGAFMPGETEDGNFYFVDPTSWADPDDDYQLNFLTTLRNVSSAGEMSWFREYPSVYCESVIQTSDGGYALAGTYFDPAYYPFTI